MFTIQWEHEMWKFQKDCELRLYSLVTERFIQVKSNFDVDALGDSHNREPGNYQRGKDPSILKHWHNRIFVMELLPLISSDCSKNFPLIKYTSHYGDIFTFKKSFMYFSTIRVYDKLCREIWWFQYKHHCRNLCIILSDK